MMTSGRRHAAWGGDPRGKKEESTGGIRRRTNCRMLCEIEFSGGDRGTRRLLYSEVVT
jgi:hypothetical protein